MFPRPVPALAAAGFGMLTGSSVSNSASDSALNHASSSAAPMGVSPQALLAVHRSRSNAAATGRGGLGLESQTAVTTGASDPLELRLLATEAAAAAWPGAAARSKQARQPFNLDAKL